MRVPSLRVGPWRLHVPRLPREPIVRVGEAATVSLVTVRRDVTAAEALHTASVCDIRHLLVVEAAELLGVLCICDLLDCDPSTPVGRRMSTPPITISPSAPAELALELMRSRSIACLPLLRNGSLSGVVTRRDLRGAGRAFREPRCARCGDNRHVRLDETSAFVCVPCLLKQRAESPR